MYENCQVSKWELFKEVRNAPINILNDPCQNVCLKGSTCSKGIFLERKKINRSLRVYFSNNSYPKPAICIYVYTCTVSPRKWRILGPGKTPPFAKSAICEVSKEYWNVNLGPKRIQKFIFSTFLTGKICHLEDLNS